MGIAEVARFRAELVGQGLSEKRINVAEAHARELPEHVRDAAAREPDPDRRILAMLGALRVAATRQQTWSSRREVER